MVIDYSLQYRDILSNIKDHFNITLFNTLGQEQFLCIFPIDKETQTIIAIHWLY